MAKCFYFRQRMTSSDESGIQVNNSNAEAAEAMTSEGQNKEESSTAAGLSNCCSTSAENGTHLNLSLSDAILDADYFLSVIGINDDGSKMETDLAAPASSSTTDITPTNTSPIVTPKLGSSPIDIAPSLLTTSTWQPGSSLTSQEFKALPDLADEIAGLSEISSTCSSLSDMGVLGGHRMINVAAAKAQNSEARPSGQFRSLATGLDPIPEDGVTKPPETFQPLVPPPTVLPKPVTTTYNISFPKATTLQPRLPDFSWRPNAPPIRTPSPGMMGTSPASNVSSLSFPQSPAHSNQPSPFHNALSSKPWDPSVDCLPLNLVPDGSHHLPPPPPQAATTSSSSKKRSRRNTPSAQDYRCEDEDAVRQRSRKSAVGGGNSGTSTPAEWRRRDSIKNGLDELQRLLGRAEDDKMSQASVLQEGGKHIRTLRADGNKLTAEIEAVRKKRDQLHNEIERFQSQLPANGAPPLPKVLAMKKLCDLYHDHVVEKTKIDWRYWVFVSIMGHFVHPFDKHVASSGFEELESTSMTFLGEHMSLQQLRKDAFRKLAKVSAKTSIVENPAKLPSEALAFVTMGERVFKGEDEEENIAKRN